jgi:hypothetical protein
VVWADPAAPPDVLRYPSAAVLEFLVGDGLWTGALMSALHNPALPTSVLAERAKGEARAMIAAVVLYDPAGVALLRRAPGTGYRADPDATPSQRQIFASLALRP